MSAAPNPKSTQKPNKPTVAPSPSQGHPDGLSRSIEMKPSHLPQVVQTDHLRTEPPADLAEPNIDPMLNGALKDLARTAEVLNDAAGAGSSFDDYDEHGNMRTLGSKSETHSDETVHAEEVNQSKVPVTKKQGKDIPMDEVGEPLVDDVNTGEGQEVQSKAIHPAHTLRDDDTQHSITSISLEESVSHISALQDSVQKQKNEIISLKATVDNLSTSQEHLKQEMNKQVATMKSYCDKLEHFISDQIAEVIKAAEGKAGAKTFADLKSTPVPSLPATTVTPPAQKKERTYKINPALARMLK